MNMGQNDCLNTILNEFVMCAMWCPKLCHTIKQWKNQGTALEVTILMKLNRNAIVDKIADEIVS